MAAIVGIDLGTSTTEVTVYRDGKTILIPDYSGQTIVPSVVGIDSEERIIVGKQAQDQYLLYPDKTVIEVKRLIGSGERIPMGTGLYTPAELSAEILSYVKHYAEDYLGEEVDRAVITVPAYFTNQQRNETIEAGRLAGLSVERIINEPTAAALCYGVNHMEEESHILVYDFGGGTFDVTILEMFGGVLEVKASSGDNQLGGKDIDQKLIEYFLKIGKEKYSLELKDDIYAMVKLKEAAIDCKIALSTQKSYELLLPMIGTHADAHVSIREVITVELFEEMIRDLVERTQHAVEVVLKDAALSKDRIDMILLVGGTTRIPCVRRYVKALFGKEPEESVDPDIAVAIGAGIQSAILDGRIDKDTGIMLTDVAPYPLGVRTVVGNEMYFDNDYLDILIPRNVTIPVTRVNRYHTFAPAQTGCDIEVYQGDLPKATSNVFLGKFHLKGIPPREAGKEAVDVEFSYDLNGILQVSARVVSTGNQASITIETAGVEAESVDLEAWRDAPDARKFRSTIRKAEKRLKEDMDPVDLKELESLLEVLKRNIIRGGAIELLEELELDLIDFMEEMWED